MNLDRRNFLKSVGLAGLTLSVSPILGAESLKDDLPEFKGVLYDSTRCVGCMECEIACARSHGHPDPQDTPEPGTVRKTDDSRRSVINSYTTSKGDFFIRNQCMHCNEPACVAACLSKAMYKTKEGPVIWRADKCMGCRYCMVSCPFDIPKFEYFSANPRIIKCDMCYDRVQNGLKTRCTEVCPAEALVFGTRRELIAEARKRIVENPDTYIDKIYGEKAAGGTGFIYLSSVPFKELGMNEKLQNSSYPALSKSFLYAVPSVFILLPPLLLGLHEATKLNQRKDSENE